MNNPLSLTIICVIVWCIWPSLAKVSKLQPTTITFFICVVTALTALIFMYVKKDIQLSTGTTTRGVMIIVVAGILNGIGMVTYSSLLSSSSGFDISKYVVMISCLMPVGTTLAAWIILGEHISMQKIFSIVIILSGVYFLQKS